MKSIKQDRPSSPWHPLQIRARRQESKAKRWGLHALGGGFAIAGGLVAFNLPGILFFTQGAKPGVFAFILSFFIGVALLLGWMVIMLGILERQERKQQEIKAREESRRREEEEARSRAARARAAEEERQRIQQEELERRRREEEAEEAARLLRAAASEARLAEEELELVKVEVRQEKTEDGNPPLQPRVYKKPPENPDPRILNELRELLSVHRHNDTPSRHELDVRVEERISDMVRRGNPPCLLDVYGQWHTQLVDLVSLAQTTREESEEYALMAAPGGNAPEENIPAALQILTLIDGRANDIIIEAREARRHINELISRIEDVSVELLESAARFQSQIDDQIEKSRVAIRNKPLTAEKHAGRIKSAKEIRPLLAAIVKEIEAGHWHQNRSCYRTLYNTSREESIVANLPRLADTLMSESHLVLEDGKLEIFENAGHLMMRQTILFATLQAQLTRERQIIGMDGEEEMQAQREESRRRAEAVKRQEAERRRNSHSSGGYHGSRWNEF